MYVCICIYIYIYIYIYIKNPQFTFVGNIYTGGVIVVPIVFIGGWMTSYMPINIDRMLVVEC